MKISSTAFPLSDFNFTHWSWRNEAAEAVYEILPHMNGNDKGVQFMGTFPSRQGAMRAFPAHWLRREISKIIKLLLN